MSRSAVANSTPARHAAWREAYDVTECQAKLVVALIAAHNVGLGPVTVTDLAPLVGLDVAQKTADLERMLLIECVGFASSRAKLWRATARGFKRFGQPVPELPPIVETSVSRSELMQARYEERRRGNLKERYQRNRRSA